MTKKFYYTLVSLIFFLVFLLHLARVVFGWDVFIADESIPMWVSWLMIVVVGLLLHESNKLRKRAR